jgi:glycosyltransferase involved in cell wall biosynthesis
MATDVGGTSELVIDNLTGYLIPTPSTDDIEKCIERYINTESEVLEKIIDNAYLNIQKYDLDNIFKQIEYIYEREVTK